MEFAKKREDFRGLLKHKQHLPQINPHSTRIIKALGQLVAILGRLERCKFSPTQYQITETNHAHKKFCESVSELHGLSSTSNIHGIIENGYRLLNMFADFMGLPNLVDFINRKGDIERKINNTTHAQPAQHLIELYEWRTSGYVKTSSKASSARSHSNSTTGFPTELSELDADGIPTTYRRTKNISLKNGGMQSSRGRPKGNHAPKDKKKYLCSLCGEGFTEKRNKIRHEHQQHNSDKRFLKCRFFPHCSVMKSSASNMKEHIRCLHTDLRYICVECTGQYRQTREWRNHLVKKHGYTKDRLPRPKLVEVNQDTRLDHVTVAYMMDRSEKLKMFKKQLSGRAYGKSQKNSRSKDSSSSTSNPTSSDSSPAQRRTSTSTGSNSRSLSDREISRTPSPNSSSSVDPALFSQHCKTVQVPLALKVEYAEIPPPPPIISPPIVPYLSSAFSDTSDLHTGSPSARPFPSSPSFPSTNGNGFCSLSGNMNLFMPLGSATSIQPSFQHTSSHSYQSVPTPVSTAYQTTQTPYQVMQATPPATHAVDSPTLTQNGGTCSMNSTALSLHHPYAVPLNPLKLEPLNMKPPSHPPSHTLSQSTLQPLSQHTLQPLSQPTVQPLSQSTLQPLSHHSLQSFSQPAQHSAQHHAQHHAQHPAQHAPAQYPAAQHPDQHLVQRPAQPSSQSPVQPQAQSQTHYRLNATQPATAYQPLTQMQPQISAQIQSQLLPQGQSQITNVSPPQCSRPLPNSPFPKLERSFAQSEVHAWLNQIGSFYLRYAPEFIRHGYGTLGMIRKLDDEMLGQLIPNLLKIHRVALIEAIKELQATTSPVHIQPPVEPGNLLLTNTFSPNLQSDFFFS